MSSTNHGNRSRQAHRLGERQQARQQARQAQRNIAASPPGWFARFREYWSPQAAAAAAPDIASARTAPPALNNMVAVVADSDVDSIADDSAVTDNNIMPPPPPRAPVPVTAAVPVAAAAAAPPVQVAAPTLAQGAPFTFQRQDWPTHRHLQQRSQVRNHCIPVPENQAIRDARARLVDDLAQGEKCHRAPEIVRFIEAEGPQTDLAILEELGYTNLGTNGFTYPISAMKEAGILVYDIKTKKNMLAPFYWFLVPHPTTNPPVRAPAAPYQWQELNQGTFAGLNGGNNICYPEMPVPHDDAILAHRVQLVERIANKGSLYRNARNVVQLLESGPKTMDQLKVALGYAKPGTHYMTKPIMELKNAGIIVYNKKDRFHYLTPFYLFSAP